MHLRRCALTGRLTKHLHAPRSNITLSKSEPHRERPKGNADVSCNGNLFLRYAVLPGGMYLSHADLLCSRLQDFNLCALDGVWRLATLWYLAHTLIVQALGCV